MRSSWLLIFSKTIILRSWSEWDGPEKWAPTGLSLSYVGCHGGGHSGKCGEDFLSHPHTAFGKGCTGWCFQCSRWPVDVLCTKIPVFTCWQVRHLELPHAVVPRVGSNSVGFSCALTRRSRRFFGCLKPITGGSGMAFLRRDDACSTGRRDLVIICSFGRLGWNVVIRGIRLVLFVLGRGVSKLSWLTSRTLFICLYKRCFFYPLRMRWCCSLLTLKFSSVQQIRRIFWAWLGGLDDLQWRGWQQFAAR